MNIALAVLVSDVSFMQCRLEAVVSKAGLRSRVKWFSITRSPHVCFFPLFFVELSSVQTAEELPRTDGISQGTQRSGRSRCLMGFLKSRSISRRRESLRRINGAQMQFALERQADPSLFVCQRKCSFIQTVTRMARHRLQLVVSYVRMYEPLTALRARETDPQTERSLRAVSERKCASLTHDFRPTRPTRLNDDRSRLLPAGKCA